jgi:hypothetical protein
LARSTPAFIGNNMLHPLKFDWGSQQYNVIIQR